MRDRQKAGCKNRDFLKFCAVLWASKLKKCRFFENRIFLHFGLPPQWTSYVYSGRGARTVVAWKGGSTPRTGRSKMRGIPTFGCAPYPPSWIYMHITSTVLSPLIFYEFFKILLLLNSWVVKVRDTDWWTTADEGQNDHRSLTSFAEIRSGKSRSGTFRFYYCCWFMKGSFVCGTMQEETHIPGFHLSIDFQHLLKAI